MESMTGELFASTLDAKDARTRTALVAPEIDFKGLTPDGFEKRLRRFIREKRAVWPVVVSRPTPLLNSQNRSGECRRLPVVRYRFANSNDGGVYEVQQQTYFKTDGG